MRHHLSAPSKRTGLILLVPLAIALFWQTDATLGLSGRTTGVPGGPPRLLGSTLLGGRGQECIEALVIDAAGNICVTGWTTSTDLPVTANALQSRPGGNRDAFILRLSPDGRTILYGSYLGGAMDDTAQSIALDSAGNILIGGSTKSADFPLRTPLQPAHGGASDGFALRLSPDGATLQFATYLGGSGDEELMKIVVTASGSICLAGTTDSRNFPTRSAFSPTYRGGESDGFITLLDPTGSAISWSTHLGGAGIDAISSIAIDNNGGIYATGATGSADFPTLNPFQAAVRGDIDGFVTKISPDGQSLGYSTLLGGTDIDAGTDLAVNSLGEAYITGLTASHNFPVEIPIQPYFGGGTYDGFVTRLRGDGRKLLYSTYLGGNGSSTLGDDEVYGIALDSQGFAYVTGATSSPVFPTTTSAKADHRDAFVAKLGVFGAPLVYSTYLGGAGSEIGRDIALDSQSNASIVGTSTSPDFPLMQSTRSGLLGESDGFVTRVEATNRGTITIVSAASYSAGAMAPDSIVAAFGTGLSDVTQLPTTTPLPTELGGVRVVMNDVPVPFFFVSPNQINFQFPPHPTIELRTFYIYNDGAVIGIGEITVAPIAPALFSIDGSGSGLPAAFALRVRADGTTVSENVAFRQPVSGEYLAQPVSFGAESDLVFLVLFATGVRHRSALSNVSATIGGVDAQVVYCGPQNQFVGLDQVNIRLPRSLRSRGELPVVLNVDGRSSNSLRVVLGN